MGPQRVRTFLWLCFKGKLLTNDERFRRHLTEMRGCVRCDIGGVDVDHVLHQCPFAKSVWRILMTNTVPSFYQGTVMDWLVNNLLVDNRVGFDKWGSIFGIVCWMIWEDRNIAIFEKKMQDPH